MAYSFSSRVIPAVDVLFRRVEDEIVLLNLKSETYFGLDPVGTRMWEALTSSSTIQAACEALLEEYEVAPATLHADLEAFLDKLIGQGLITVSSE